MFPLDCSTKRYFIHERNFRVQRTKFYERKLLLRRCPIVEYKNESREKNGGHFISFYLEIDHVDIFLTVKNTVTYVTVQNSLSHGTIALTVRITPRGLWEINITKKVRGNNTFCQYQIWSRGHFSK
jgi:hypothetical protein